MSEQAKRVTDWRRERRWDGIEMGGRAKGLSAVGNGGQAAISLTPDVEGTDSCSLLDSILSTILKN